MGTVESQVKELQQELKDIEPKLETIGESMRKKRDKIKLLHESRASKSEQYKNEDEVLRELRAEVKELQSTTDSELLAGRDLMQGISIFKVRPLLCLIFGRLM